jgi:diguanylate cyclase (GGDEF)-like protein
MNTQTLRAALPAVPSTHSPAYKIYAVTWAAVGVCLLVAALPAVPHLPAMYAVFVALSVAGHLITIQIGHGITLAMQASLAPVWLFGWQAGPPILLLSGLTVAAIQRVSPWRALLYFGNTSAWVTVAGILFRHLHPLPAGNASWQDLLAAVATATVFVTGNALTVSFSRFLDTGDRGYFQIGRLASVAGIAFLSVMPLSYLLTTTSHSGPAPHVLTVIVWLLVAVALKGFVETRETNQRLQQALRELHEVSVTDPLTGLFNRRHFNEVLEREVDRHVRHAQSLSLLIMDLCGFKAVNDTYGHPAGDGVLVQVSAEIRSRLRRTDLAFRIGGDEFAVVLPQTDHEGAASVARDLCQQIREAPFTARGTRIALTARIGVATLPDDGSTMEALMHAADEALYATRRVGAETLSTPATALDAVS